MPPARGDHRDGRCERPSLSEPQKDHASQAEATGPQDRRRPRALGRGRGSDADRHGGDRRPGEGGAARSWKPARTRSRRSRTCSPTRRSSEMPTIWVFADVAPDGSTSAAPELLTKARSLGADLAAVALGPGATQAAGALGAHGASTVYASDDAVFAEHPGRPAAFVLAGLIEEHRPDLVLFPGTYDARDVAGRVQARTGATLMSNATDVLATDRARTEIFGGTKIVDVSLGGSGTKLVLVRPSILRGRAQRGHGHRRHRARRDPGGAEDGARRRTARRVGERSQARGGEGRPRRRARARWSGRVRAARRARRRPGRRGGRRLARRRRRPLGALRVPDWADRQDRQARGVHRDGIRARCSTSWG